MSINYNNVDFIKPKFVNFNDGVDYKTIGKTKTHYGEGVFSIKKDIFTHLNGFEPWRCAADSDFMGRLYKNNYKLKTTKDVVFYRRIHKNSLTQSTQTSYFSLLRKEYATVSKNKTSFGPLPELIVKPYVEVFPNEILPIVINKTPISEMMYVESSSEKYSKITEIIGRNRNLQPIDEVYVKTSNISDISSSLSISPRQNNGNIVNNGNLKTNRATNDRLFGKKRR